MSIMTNGFPTTISLADGVVLKEKTVKAPGYSGGGGIDTTTMRNTRVRTKVPKKLLEITDGAVTVTYDPAQLADIVSQLQVLQEITITFPDGEVETFWGWLDTFEPGELSNEEEQPTAECAIIASGQDTDYAETLPSVA